MNNLLFLTISVFTYSCEIIIEIIVEIVFVIVLPARDVALSVYLLEYLFISVLF